MHQPFNFTWDAGRYDKESSNYVTVTLQPAVSTVTAGINLIEQLASNGTYLPYGSQKYSAQLPIIFEYSAAQTGNYTLTVLENYNAYGVSAILACLGTIGSSAISLVGKQGYSHFHPPHHADLDVRRSDGHGLVTDIYLLPSHV